MVKRTPNLKALVIKATSVTKEGLLEALKYTPLLEFLELDNVGDDDVLASLTIVPNIVGK